MVNEIGREEVERLLAQGAQLVDVLPREQYEEEHIPGALSAPLSHLQQEVGRLQRSRAIIVYCYDSQ
jgi:rhodanese-related sulfurtransferase